MIAEAAESELVRRCRTPGPARSVAERELCRRYGARVLRYAERHLRDASTARDLAQLALLAVIEALREGRVEDPDRLGAFVLSTCRYLVWDENRARARDRKLSEKLAVDDFLVEITTVAFDHQKLSGCIQTLPPREQRVVLLSYCEEWTAERIAGELATTAGNVRVIRHRALERLQRCLGDER